MSFFSRNFVAVIVGLLVGGMVNSALVIAGATIIPAPPDVVLSDAKSLAAGAHLLEARHFLFPFLAHAAGTFAGALIAYFVGIGPRAYRSYGVGVVFLAGGIAAATMIPAPAWFIGLDLLVAYLPMAWLAVRVGRTLRPPTAA